MFLVNSRLDYFSSLHPGRRPFSRSYGAILPSSLTRVLSRALGSSPHLPVSVCGTGTSNLARGFFRQYELTRFATCFRSPSLLMVSMLRICLQHPLVAWTCSSNRTLGLSSCVTPSLNRFAVVLESQPIIHHLRLSASA